MQFTYDKTRKIADIYEEILPLIKRIYAKYDYLEISLDEYRVEIIRFLQENINKRKSGYNEEILTKKINSFFVKCVSSRLNEPKTSLKIIENYISKYIHYSNNYDDLIKMFDSLDSFFVKFNYIPDPLLITSLVNNNETINKIIKDIVFKNISEIKSGNMNIIFDNATIIYFAESYCLNNNIEFENKDNLSQMSFDINSIVSDNEKLFYKEINNIKILTYEETQELLRRYFENNDRQARNKLLEHNLRYIATIAQKYKNRGLDFLDLVQEGSLGFIKAIDNFDMSKGFRLTTYATFWVCQAMNRAIALKSRNIRIPVHVSERLHTYNQIKNELELKLNREPTMKEIAMEMGISVKMLSDLLNKTKDTYSINNIINTDEDTELGEFLTANSESFEDEVCNRDLAKRILELFKRCNLNEKEIEVLVRRFGLCGKEEETLESIGKTYRVSRERIRQIESRAIAKIRRSSYITEFLSYADKPEKALQTIRPTRSPQTTLEEIDFEVSRKMLSLMEYLNRGDKKYSREEILVMLSKLANDERQLIDLRYSTDSILTKEESIRFYTSLVPRMKRLLDNPTGTRKKKLISETGVVSATILKVKEEVVDNIYNPEIQNDNNEKDKSFNCRRECTKISELFNSSTFTSMLDLMAPKEALIVSLKLGIIDNKVLSTSDIASLLNITLEEVIDTTKKALLGYIDNVVNFIEPVVNDQHVKKLKPTTKKCA